MNASRHGLYLIKINLECFLTNQLIPCSRTVFDKLTVTQFVKEFSAFIELEGSLPCPQDLPLDLILRQLNPVYTFTSYFQDTF
jgi:hypothetical protein